MQGSDPLDPEGLNRIPTVEEQKSIADTLNTIKQGSAVEIAALNPHPYKNYPDFATGAVLPPSAAGYTAYYIPSGSRKAGVARLVIDNGTEAVYYTNNHYLSFYAVTLPP